MALSRPIDLELETLWFTKNPIIPPVRLQAFEGGFHCALSLTQTAPSSCKMVLALRWLDDLTSTKFRLTWDPSAPRRTVQSKRRDYPAPPPLTAEQLKSYQRRYGARIVRWCRDRRGSRVGDGECWTLAFEALTAVAAKCAARGEEAAMVSQGRVHGSCIYVHRMPSLGSPRQGFALAGVGPGDVLELDHAHFKTQIRLPGSTGTKMRQQFAHQHTAVITHVRDDVLEVLEQNSDRLERGVTTGAYAISDLVDGVMRIYRPVGKSWCVLTTNWE
ncbi:MAG: hypothetical protein M1826_004130 [Phylliscum demangeonii]|nr:MAG: hypothetical protein M1826_004130 [Phylliscum demangeonii]